MIIGIDPDPGHHTSAALELFGKLAEWRTFPNTPAGLEEFLSWLESWAEASGGGRANPALLHPLVYTHTCWRKVIR
jgi:hypothetical protein